MKKKIVKVRAKREQFRFIGVRFLTANVAKIYTYQIAKRHKVRHGDLLVVENHHGLSVVAVVSVDVAPSFAEGEYDLKTITQKVAAL